MFTTRIGLLIALMTLAICTTLVDAQVNATSSTERQKLLEYEGDDLRIGFEPFIYVTNYFIDNFIKLQKINSNHFDNYKTN
jgi:hypothetical protein